MANSKISGLTEDATPAAQDVIWSQDSTGANDYKVQFQNISAAGGFITNRTENTAPDRTADYLLMHDASGTANTKILFGRAGPVLQTLSSFSASNDPADATSYYWAIFQTAAMGTAAVNNPWYVPVSGTIRTVDVFFRVAGTAASTETSTLYLRKNDTTDGTVTSAINLSANYHELVTGLAISVTAGDTIQCKWTTPTWATNPTDVYPVIQVLVE